jgi:hypothetical protein
MLRKRIASSPNLGRTKPILELTAVEQHLQRADRQTQRGEAEEVERLALGVARLADEDQDAERRERPDRQVARSRAADGHFHA